MDVRPEFLACAGGQVRVWRTGTGMDCLVLPGLRLGAAARARRLAASHSGLAFVVVELLSVPAPGDAGVPAAAALVLDAVRPLGLPRALLAYDLALPLALEVRRLGGVPGLPVLGLEMRMRRRAGLLGRVLPVPDGTHLVSMWAHLRDNWLLEDGDERARRDGARFPSACELHETVLEYARAPAAYTAFWSALERALDGLDFGQAQVRPVQEDALPALPAPAAARWPSLPQSAGLPVPASWREYVDTPAGRFHVRRHGHKGEALIMLQSAPGSAAPLEPIATHLGRWFRVHAPDFLGNGESAKPPRTPDIAQIAREILGLADSLGLQRFLLWGTHTGAKVALSIARQAPQRVQGIVLDGLSMMEPGLRADVLQHYLPPLSVDRWGRHLLQAWNMRRDMFLFWPWYRQAVEGARPMPLPSVASLHDWTIALLQSGPAYEQSYRAAFECDARGLLKGLRAPLLLCVGPDDMFARDIEAARAALPPGARIARTPATAWYPHQSAPAVERTLQIYARFFLSLGAGGNCPP